MNKGLFDYPLLPNAHRWPAELIILDDECRARASYVRPDLLKPKPGDEREGEWLEQMDARFCERVARAISAGQERCPRRQSSGTADQDFGALAQDEFAPSWISHPEFAAEGRDVRYVIDDLVFYGIGAVALILSVAAIAILFTM